MLFSSSLKDNSVSVLILHSASVTMHYVSAGTDLDNRMGGGGVVVLRVACEKFECKARI